MRTRMAAGGVTLAWHVVTALVVAVCVVVQLTLTVRGDTVLVDENGVPLAGLPMRVLRFFTYFTIQSNLLAMAAAVALALRPSRDGGVWRAVRVASVVGMAVTFVVYQVALAPILDLHGAAWWTDLGFHTVAPALTVIGWVVLGPRGQFDARSAARFVVWPVCWLGYVLVLGAATGWYPYPFLDVDAHGYGRVVVNCLLVALLLIGAAAAGTAVDARLTRPRPSTYPRVHGPDATGP